MLSWILILLIAVWPKFSFPIFYGNITEDQLSWSHLAPWICNEKIHISAQNESFSIKHSKWQWMSPSPVFSIHKCYKLEEKLSYNFAGFSRFRCVYELEVDHCLSKKHSERNTLTTHLLIIVPMLLFLHFVFNVPFPFCYKLASWPYFLVRCVSQDLCPRTTWHFTLLEPDILLSPSTSWPLS